MLPPSSIGVVVLCGGDSRRMGRAKASLPFGPESLLERTVRLASGQGARPVVVVAAPGQQLPVLPGTVVIVRDTIAGRGPLQGLAAGLAACSEVIEFVYATATDAPFLEPAWVDRLAGLIGEKDMAVPRVDGRFHPLSALYRRKAVAPIVERLLRAGTLRLTALVEENLGRARVVLEDELRPVDPGLGTIRNLNRPDDYRQALRDAGLPVPARSASE